MECPMLAPISEVSNQKEQVKQSILKHIPPQTSEVLKIIRKPNEQKKAPMIMRRAIQNNRQRLNAAAPYPMLKENRGIRIINPANPMTTTNSGPKIRPAIIRTVRPVKPQNKISQPISQQQQPSPSTNNNIPLQVQNPSKP
uniref:Uncharacterized protein n=1 Tax=Panagrolaimus davidi TaxID=227884 RepID=A0A914QE32_9BILA